MDITQKAREFAVKAHHSTNHNYGIYNYSMHLNMVLDVANRHIDIVAPKNREEVLAACWLHDTIEDCRLTYNDIKKEFGENIAEIVYALSNEKGKNRKERANDKYYRGIRNTPNATFVKMCGRLANIRFSHQTNSRMFDIYKNENQQFLFSLIAKQSSAQQLPFFGMISEMERLLKN